MLMKRILVLMVAMLSIVPVVYAQQELLDSARILGDWRIVKIDANVYSQKDNRLLEQKTLEIGNVVPQLRIGVPLSIRFMGDSCILRTRESERGTYRLSRGENESRLSFQRKTDHPGPPPPIMSYTYKLVEPAQMVLVMPAAYYKEAVRTEGVKVVYSCYYKRN